MVLDLGVSPDRIIFANTFKEVQHIKHSAENGVDMMTFDCEMELLKIKKFHPSAKYDSNSYRYSLDIN